MTSTCQICGRAIKANTGLIAHHGYRRPHQYHQTASCFGARHRPYEVAHDAIDEYLVLLDDWIARAITARDDFRAEPPAQLTFFVKHDAWDHLGTKIVVDRPDGFDPKSGRDVYTPRAYANVYANRVAENERWVRDLTADHTELTARRAAWVAPPAVLDNEPMWDEPAEAPTPEFNQI